MRPSLTPLDGALKAPPLARVGVRRRLAKTTPTRVARPSEVGAQAGGRRPAAGREAPSA